MNTKFYDIQLLQKYRKNISKRYRGYNKVYQINQQKFIQSEGEGIKHQDNHMKNKEKYQQSQSECLNTKIQKSQESENIIIKSKNGQIMFKMVNSQAEFNNKKFVKKKFAKKYQQFQTNQQLQQQQQNIKRNRIGIINLQKIFQDHQNTEDEVIQRRLKFLKKPVKQSQKVVNSEQNQLKQIKILIKSQFQAYQPFNPTIKGQKKITFVPNKKKSKTFENQSLLQKYNELQKRRTQIQNQQQRILKNSTDIQKSVNYNFNQKVKRSSSYLNPTSLISQRQDSKKLTYLNPFSPVKFQKKSSIKVQSTMQYIKSIKQSQNNQEVKLIFPKIDKDKQMIIQKQQQNKNNSVNMNKSNNMTPNKSSITNTNNNNNSYLNNTSLKYSTYFDQKRKNDKYKKTPLLLKYQFNVKDIDSQSYIVLQSQSQMLLHGYRFNNTYQIASLTKIMTLYVCLNIVTEYNINIKEEKVQISQKYTNIGGTSAEIFSGEIYTLESLFYGLMLPSGNDAALALAAWGGRVKSSGCKCQSSNSNIKSSSISDIQFYIKQFINLMNKTAKQLQLYDTRFANPHGLPHQYAKSTAFDIGRLCIKCMKNDYFKKVVQTRQYKCVVKTLQGRKRLNSWQNTNKLLRRQGFIGIKTGITITAGPCLASAYTFKDQTYICVILRAKKISRRFKQTRKILNWCLNKMYENNLNQQEINVLKKLKKNNAQLDSDYSEDQTEFRYDKNNSKEFRRRCNIISQMG